MILRSRVGALRSAQREGNSYWLIDPEQRRGRSSTSVRRGRVHNEKTPKEQQFPSLKNSGKGTRIGLL